METDRRYFLEGLFIIGLSVGAALLFVWLQRSGHSDDVQYRIHFDESVSGLALGDPVKFNGVDVGTVTTLALDTNDPRKVQVDVKLRKDSPVKTDTRATLRLKGITGVVFIELNGGAPNAPTLVAATSQGAIPEILADKSSLNTVIDKLPAVVAKFGAIETQTKKVLTDVGEVADHLKNNPLVRFGSKKTAAPEPAANTDSVKNAAGPHNR